MSEQEGWEAKEFAARAPPSPANGEKKKSARASPAEESARVPSAKKNGEVEEDKKKFQLGGWNKDVRTWGALGIVGLGLVVTKLVG